MHHHDKIDRIRPMLRPEEPPVMTQTWEHLLFLHWTVPVAELQKRVPSELSIDTFEGKAYVGLVPFFVRDVRAGIVPVPLAPSFSEINVRTYVHRKGEDPGVWFFSLDASSALAASAARALYRLQYFHAEMITNVSQGALPEITMSLRRTAPDAEPAIAHLGYRPVEGPGGIPAPRSLDSFLINRYVLYTARDHRLWRARIHHAPPRVERAEVTRLEETLVWAAGVKRGESAPLAHYVRQVEGVEVFAPEECGTAT